MARQYRTLGELRTEMRAAIGSAASGAVAGVNQTNIDAKLRIAQTLLYYTHDWAHLRRYEDKQTGAASTLIDYPATADQDRIKAISVYRGGVWSPPLKKGITPQMYTYQLNRSWPQRWEPYEQIEIYPQTDQDYLARIFFVKQLGALVQDTDRFTIDDTLVSIVATALLKAHYRQPDAGEYKIASDSLLNNLKARSWGQTVFNAKDWRADELLVRPQVV